MLEQYSYSGEFMLSQVSVSGAASADVFAVKRF